MFNSAPQMILYNNKFLLLHDNLTLDMIVRVEMLQFLSRIEEFLNHDKVL